MADKLKNKLKKFKDGLLPSKPKPDHSSASRSPSSEQPTPSRGSSLGAQSSPSLSSTSTPLAGSTISHIAIESPTTTQPPASAGDTAVVSVHHPLPSSLTHPRLSNSSADPLTESGPVPSAAANLPSIAIPPVAPETESSTIAAPSPQRTNLAQWWDLHRDDIVSSVVKVFGVTSKVLELVPLAEPAAKAFEHAASVLEVVQRSWENVDAVRDLTQQMERIIVALGRCEQPPPPAMQQRITTLREDFSRLAAAWGEHAAKSWPKRVINADNIAEELASLGGKVKALVDVFMLESALSVEPAVDTIRRIVLDVQKKQETSEGNALIDRLRPVRSAWYDSAGSPTGCLPGTRKSLLRDIMAWFTSDGPPVYWLKGLAGTGKTTIARSVAELAAQQGSLGATFFFSRTDIARRNPLAVIPTLAYSLARWRLELRRLICAALEVHPDIADHGSAREQVRRLLAEALSTLSSPVPRVLIVLDALDECDQVDGVEGGELLPALFDCLGVLPIAAKILITSRDEPSIRSLFATEQSDHPALSLALHTDIEAHLVNADLSLYLMHELGRVGKATGDMSWPPSWVVKELAQRAGTLFVYAATVVNYINTGRTTSSLAELLAEVMAGEVHEAGHRWQLDRLYSQILMKASSSVGLYSDRQRILVLETVASLVLLQEPLPADAISRLVDRPRALVHCLDSVLWEADDGTVRLFHPSFADFVGDPKRCTSLSFPTNEGTMTGISFLVLPEEHHHRLARRCLTIMNAQLQYDIVGLGKPWIPNVEIVELRQMLDRRVPHELRYACKFWALHLAKAGRLEDTLLTELHIFCRGHLLHWLELLSLMGALSVVGNYLPDVLGWCQAHIVVSELSEVDSLLSDIMRLLPCYWIPISSYALHVYHSAAVTMPECALAGLMFLQFKGVPRLSSARPEGWGPNVRVFEGHKGTVTSVAFSPDGKHVVSGSHDGSVRIWDAQTGAQRVLHEGHLEQVTSVAFSTDGKLIASGSNNHTIRMWDAQAGIQRARLEGHKSTVTSVAFSTDSKQIVSGSFDRTIRIWDTETGVQRAVLQGHADSVNSVVFSTDGKQIVSGSNDKTVRVWDALSGAQRGLLEGHEKWVKSVVFSMDGKHIVSGSADHSVRIWDAHTGVHRTVLEGHKGPVTSVSFSTDSKQIASGSYDNTIRIWNAHTGDQCTLLEGHTNPVISVAFSPDSKQIVSGSSGKTIRVWDAHISVPLALLEGHSAVVTSVSFSTDGTQIVSSSCDNTICVWDAQTGVRRALLEGHSNVVTSAIFSMDSTQIISGSWDQTVRVWDAQTGLQRALLEGHSRVVMSVAISMDGKLIASGSGDNTVRIWNAHLGNQHALLKGHKGGVASVAFSTDGKQVASGSYDHTIRVWDTQTSVQRVLLEGHTNPVASVAFSTDGRQIVSGSADKTIRVWDTQTGIESALLKGHMEKVVSVAFSTDDKQIVSTSHDGETRMWSFNTAMLGTDHSAEEPSWHSLRARDATSENPYHVVLSYRDAVAWVMGSWLGQETPVPLCWLPTHRRGPAQAVSGSTLVIGAYSGAITILDFKAMLAMVDYAGMRAV